MAEGNDNRGWSVASVGISGGISPDDPDWTPLHQRTPMEQARWFAFFGPGKSASGVRQERALTRPGDNPAIASPMLYVLLQQQDKQAVEDFFAAMRNSRKNGGGKKSDG